MKLTYSTLDVVKALNIPRALLREWMGRSLIKPAVSAKGKGTKAVFSRVDVYGIELFQYLMEMGFQRDTAAKWVEIFIKNCWFAEFSESAYVKFTIKDGDVEVELLGDSETIVKEANRAVFILDFRSMRDQVNNSLSML